MAETLFERLGGEPGIRANASDVVDNHLANPVTGKRFVDSDVAALKNAAATFFIQGTGGPEVYAGKSLIDAHRAMNISHAEFMAMLDDALDALEKNNIGQREKIGSAVCPLLHEG